MKVQASRYSPVFSLVSDKGIREDYGHLLSIVPPLFWVSKVNLTV